MPDFFITQNINTYLVQVQVLKGKHIFKALKEQQENRLPFLQALIVEIVHLNYEKITEEVLDEI